MDEWINGRKVEYSAIDQNKNKNKNKNVNSVWFKTVFLRK